MGKRSRLVLAGLAGACLAACAALAFAWPASLPVIAPPPASAFPREDIARGAVLAAIGDCAVCHTAADGRSYAGGRPVPTPFGIVYATNITPDPATGIGRWSLAAFRRAMRDGIARDGAHLYPVLPYPHFTRASDADISALYAFMMTRPSVEKTAPPNRLPFPLDQRALLAGWNLLFLHPGPFQPDPTRSAEWNRGAYLVEAVGHCGACHTPRNALGAEQARDKRFAGGDAEGWDAPALQAASAAPRAWTVDSLATYLRTGFDASHGAAAGPMAPVTHELAAVPDADVRAMAVFFAALMARADAPAPARVAAPRALDAQAAQIFAGACGACHAPDAPMTRDGAPSLALSTAVNGPTSRNVVDIILDGMPMREGRAGPYMPGFGASLTDAQVAALAAYVRARFADGPAWTDIDAAVREARKTGGGT